MQTLATTTPEIKLEMLIILQYIIKGKRSGEKSIIISRPTLKKILFFSSVSVYPDTHEARDGGGDNYYVGVFFIIESFGNSFNPEKFLKFHTVFQK